MGKMLLVGVGGAGCSIAQNIGHLLGVETLTIGSDEKALCQKKSKHKLLIESEAPGARSLDGELTEVAVDSVSSEFRKLIADSRTVILLVGLGGNTGSGAAPVLAEISRGEGLDVVALVTLPFSYEDKRRPVAKAALQRLQKEGVQLIIHDHSVESQRDDAKNQTFSNYLNSVASSFRSKVELLLQ